MWLGIGSGLDLAILLYWLTAQDWWHQELAFSLWYFEGSSWFLQNLLQVHHQWNHLAAPQRVHLSCNCWCNSGWTYVLMDVCTISGSSCCLKMTKTMVMVQYSRQCNMSKFNNWLTDLIKTLKGYWFCYVTIYTNICIYTSIKLTLIPAFSLIDRHVYVEMQQNPGKKNNPSNVTFNSL